MEVSIMNEGNNRKLIGTIIGVIFFIVLIAGATFAWLSYVANVNNGIYNVSTTHFIVTYTTDNDVTYIPILSSNATFDDYTSAGGEFILGEAHKNDGDPEGTIYFKLHVNDTPGSNALVNAECIKYLVLYRINPLMPFTNLPLSSQFDNPNGYGIISSSNMDANRDIILYEGDLQNDTSSIVSLGAPLYKIYFWLDNELVTSSAMGLTFSGYVHAFAVQKDLGVSSSSGER